MTLDAVIMLVGALVAVLPFLGFPNSWDSVFFFILGVVVIGLGIVVRRRDSHQAFSMKTPPTPQPKQTFVEAAPSEDVHIDK